MTFLRTFAVCLVVGIVSVGCGATAEKTDAGAACKCAKECKCAHCDGKGEACTCKA
jgi:hypothetical protein